MLFGVDGCTKYFNGVSITVKYSIVYLYERLPRILLNCINKLEALLNILYKTTVNTCDTESLWKVIAASQAPGSCLA